jgi:hypothetical protein
VEVLDVADGFEEVGKVVAFGEGGELRCVAEKDVDEAANAGGLQRVEEVFGGALGEADAVDIHVFSSTIIAIDALS